MQKNKIKWQQEEKFLFQKTHSKYLKYLDLYYYFFYYYLFNI